MKITIQKLGNIQNTEFDLRPLTVLVGPNNTGKTWLAYVLSAIFGLYGLHTYTQAYIEKQVIDTYPPLEIAIEQVLTDGNATLDLYSFAEILIEHEVMLPLFYVERSTQKMLSTG